MIDKNTGSGEFIGDLTNPGYYAGSVFKLASPLIKKEIGKLTTKTFYHGGLDDATSLKNLDLFKTAVKQNKKGRDYSGFYMYDESQKLGAQKYANSTTGNLHEIKISRFSKTKTLPNIERLSKTDLQKYTDEGYDMIKGTDVRGRTEYVLLNKNKVKSFNNIGEKTPIQLAESGVNDARKFVNSKTYQNTVQHNEDLGKRLNFEESRKTIFDENGPITFNNRGEVINFYSKRPSNLSIIDMKDMGKNTAENMYLGKEFIETAKPYQIENTGFHEGIHRSAAGFATKNKIYNLKSSRVLNPKMSDELEAYLGNSGETLAHSAEVGRTMGLTTDSKYPGFLKFKQMLEDVTKSGKINYKGENFIKDVYKLNTPRDYKRVFDTMTGKYFVVPTAITVGYGLSKNKFGGKLNKYK